MPSITVHSSLVLERILSIEIVRVTERANCRVARDLATSTLAVWEQVRTALTATPNTSRSRSPRRFETALASAGSVTE